MTHTELDNLFKKHQKSKKRPADFIRWAAEMGANIYSSTISSQRAGRVGISEWAACCYRVFFNQPD